MFMPKYLSTRLQDGTTSDASQNYSSTSTDFVYQVPENHIAAITRMIVTIEDSEVDLYSDEYGGLGALNNGITVKIMDKNDNDIYYLVSNTVTGQSIGSSPEKIKTNQDWASVCYDFNRVLQGGTDLDMGQFRWTFARSGSPIIIENQEKFCVNCNDNFSGLTNHFFTIQGLEAYDNSVYRDYFFRSLVGS